jgi:hypothetical protein
MRRLLMIKWDDLEKFMDIYFEEDYEMLVEYNKLREDNTNEPD